MRDNISHLHGKEVLSEYSRTLKLFYASFEKY